MKFTPWCHTEVRWWKTLAHFFRFESKIFLLPRLDLIKMHTVTMKSDSHSIVRLYLLFMRHAYFMRFRVKGNETTHNPTFFWISFSVYVAMRNFIAPKASRSYGDQSNRFRKVGIENQESCPRPLVSVYVSIWCIWVKVRGHGGNFLVSLSQTLWNRSETIKCVMQDAPQNEKSISSNGHLLDQIMLQMIFLEYE